MTQLAQLQASLTALHARLADLLAVQDPDTLRRTPVTDEWHVLDVVGHINVWGLLFLDEARFMAKYPGRPFSYEIYTTNDFDDCNEFLRQRRIGYSVAQHVEENRRLSEEISAFLDSYSGELPDHPVPLPWRSEPANIAGLLRVHVRHGYEHLAEILEALGLDD